MTTTTDEHETSAEQDKLTAMAALHDALRAVLLTSSLPDAEAEAVCRRLIDLEREVAAAPARTINDVLAKLRVLGRLEAGLTAAGDGYGDTAAEALFLSAVAGLEDMAERERTA